MLFFNPFRVVLAIANHGRPHCTTYFCMYETAESKFVITGTPQNYIYPQGRMYPINAVVVVKFEQVYVIHSIGFILCGLERTRQGSKHL
jgi:hypothetical protein